MDNATILIVDDEPFNISLLRDVLKAEYRLVAARNGEQALKRALDQPRPDLILLDIMMPEMDGYAVCRRLLANPDTAVIPIIFITAMNDEHDETLGFELGAVDYITKPISPPIVRARVRTQLALAHARAELADQNLHLERLVRERTAELEITQDATIIAMTSMAETRDNETGNHIRRTQNYIRTLAIALRTDPAFAEHLDDSVIDLLYKSAPLHDIGKVGIPDRILLKPDRLNVEEFEIMKRHPGYGRAAIAKAEQLLGDNQSSFLRYARDIAYTHHEKWDGSGYPRGLAGDAIPLAGRLMAVADVYDALISQRVYKPAFTHEKSVEIIIAGSGSYFDPRIIATFVCIAEEFRGIAKAFSDTNVDTKDNVPLPV
ncbi:MAG: two-component system response regulator [Gammaproteobacteria bacterium]|nr:two-component system response regulator [Gammaproteobacteria bacterium]